MSNTIYLYLKTHNVTGLKYLGKTTQDPFKYQGSGKHWTRHINKYGYDVTTEILFETTDPEEFKKVGLEYSEKWNIVESKDFANLMEETGTGGTLSESSIKKLSETLNDPKYKSTKGAIKEKLRLETILSKEWKDSVGVATKRKISEKQNNKEWKSTTGKEKIEKYRKTVNSEEWKVSKESKWKKYSETVKSDKWKRDNYLTCPHCDKFVQPGVYGRWHGDRCKNKL